MRYWADNASYPYQSHDLWFMTEDIRWGKYEPGFDAKALIAQGQPRRSLAEAAKELNVRRQPTSRHRRRAERKLSSTARFSILKIHRPTSRASPSSASKCEACVTPPDPSSVGGVRSPSAGDPLQMNMPLIKTEPAPVALAAPATTATRLRCCRCRSLCEISGPTRVSPRLKAVADVVVPPIDHCLPVFCWCGRSPAARPARRCRRPRRCGRMHTT